ncbi:MAG: hypothetical protein AAF587_28075 [Bacteroidota bacterium]
MSTAIQTQTNLATVTQFDCQNCGAAHSVQNPRAKFIVCQYCGSVLDAQSEEHQILKSLGNPDRHPPFSFIQIGLIGTFNNKEYQVIARTRWRMKYKEYWNEEGESGYSNEVWMYDEWLLIDENRTYFYLIEDKEGYAISEEIIPETPTLLPKDLRMSFFKKQPRRIVREYGNAEVTHFEGESNYQIKHGDKIRFATIKDRGIDYSVEWRMADNDVNIKEVEFFREIPISRRKVLEAFGNNDEIDQLNQKEGFWRFFHRVAMATGILMLLLGFRACVSSGDQIFQQEIDLGTISTTNSPKSAPIEISSPGLYRLNMDVLSMVENSEMYIFSYVLNQDSIAVSTFDGNFSWWSGYEEGEYYNETSFNTSKTFKLDEAGTYYIQLFMETPAPGSIKVSVNKGIWLTRYFFLAAIACLLAVWFAGTKFGKNS